MLGAIVGAAVLGAVGAIEGSSGPTANTPSRLAVVAQQSADAVPPGLLAELEHLDKLLDRLKADWKSGKLDQSELLNRVLFEIREEKRALVKRYFNAPAYGSVTYSEVLEKLDCVDTQLALAWGFAVWSSQSTKYVPDRIERAKKCKQALETRLRKVVTISEDDTWAHNPALGKSRLCINVRTSPAQVSVSAVITGPGDYRADIVSRLHADGSAQIRGIITLAGDYTKTIAVYDASGEKTATVTKTFTVDAPPKDGPATNPPCAKPTD